MKPLFPIVVAILVIATNAHSESVAAKELPKNQPAVEAEESEPQTRPERCTACSGSLKLQNKALGQIQILPQTSEIHTHTQESFEECDSEKGCAGVKLKDGKLVEKYGDLDAFKLAASANNGQEFQFQASADRVLNGKIPTSGDYWWMKENSPFANVGATDGSGHSQKFSKFSQSSSYSSSSGGAGGAGGLDLGANPYLNGEFAKINSGLSSSGGNFAAGQGFGAGGAGFGNGQGNGFANGQANGFANGLNNAFGGGSQKTYGSQSSFSSSQSSQNGFGGQSGFGTSGSQASLGGGQASRGGAQANFGAAQGGLAGQANFGGAQTGYGSQGSFVGAQTGSDGGQTGFGGSQGGLGGGQNTVNSFNSASSSVTKFSNGYTGSSPAPFSNNGANVNLIQNSQKASGYDFDQQQQTQENIDASFASTGNVQAIESSGGDLQQTCAGQGYICVHKAQCNNGVVNTNGGSLLHGNTQKQYCNTRTEVCCRLETASLAGAGTILATEEFSATGSQGSGLFSQTNGFNSLNRGIGSSGSGGNTNQFGGAQSGSVGSQTTGFNSLNRGSSSSGQFGSVGSSQTNGFNSLNRGGSSSGQFGSVGSTGFNSLNRGSSSSGQFGSVESSQTTGFNSLNRGGSSSGQFGSVGSSQTNGFNSFNRGSSSSGQFGSVGSSQTNGFNSLNRGSSSSGSVGNTNQFGVQQSSSYAGSNKFAGTNVGSGYGSTIAPTTSRFGGNNVNNEVYKSTSQSKFVETDSFSAGSQNNGIFSAGSSPRPGAPYLPPIDSSSGSSNIYPSSLGTSPRPIFTTQRITPSYVSSTSAPGYLPPEDPLYASGTLLLDQFPAGSSTSRPRIPFNTAIPAGCAAALKCTPIEFCTAEGVISNTTVVLTRDQNTFRVPLTDCKDISSGRIGKCCRDPYYTDPWPVNQLGKWLPNTFGNDGKYMDTKHSSTNYNNVVTVRPPGRLIENEFRRDPTPKPGQLIEITQKNIYEEEIRRQQYEKELREKALQRQIGSEYGKSQLTKEGVATEYEVNTNIRQGVVTGIRPGQVIETNEINQFSKQNRQQALKEAESSIQLYREFLPKYNGNGVCGLMHPRTPYGNRQDLEVDFAEIPWQAMVLLKTNKSLLCGGVITRPDAVLTSASCVEGLLAENVAIKGGEWKLGVDDEPLTFQIIQVRKILRHPLYSAGSLKYDVAVLVLKENLIFGDNIAPICLPSSGERLDAFYNGAGECIVTGWGKVTLQAHLQGSIMHGLNVSLINPEECQGKLQNEYPHLRDNYDQDSCVCGQPTNPANNLCKVDTGSGLACTTDGRIYTLRGIYSFDSGCQYGNQLAGFSRFDQEWYEWSIGYIESVRFAKYATIKITKNNSILEITKTIVTANENNNKGATEFENKRFNKNEQTAAGTSLGVEETGFQGSRGSIVGLQELTKVKNTGIGTTTTGGITNNEYNVGINNGNNNFGIGGTKTFNVKTVTTKQFSTLGNGGLNLETTNDKNNFGIGGTKTGGFDVKTFATKQVSTGSTGNGSFNLDNANNFGIGGTKTIKTVTTKQFSTLGNGGLNLETTNDKNNFGIGGTNTGGFDVKTFATKQVSTGSTGNGAFNLDNTNNFGIGGTKTIKTVTTKQFSTLGNGGLNLETTNDKNNFGIGGTNTGGFDVKTFATKQVSTGSTGNGGFNLDNTNNFGIGGTNTIKTVTTKQFSTSGNGGLNLDTTNDKNNFGSNTGGFGVNTFATKQIVEGNGGSNFAPQTKTITTTITQRKIIQSEPEIYTITTKPEFYTITTKPKLVRVTGRPEFYNYVTAPKTQQFVNFEASPSNTDPKYVAPGPSFSEIVGAKHTHSAQCKCNGKK